MVLVCFVSIVFCELTKSVISNSSDPSPVSPPSFSSPTFSTSGSLAISTGVGPAGAAGGGGGNAAPASPGGAPKAGSAGGASVGGGTSRASCSLI